MLGWLELPLDDAPVLVVTSFNERYVPSLVDADLFLPNRLRQQLGIIDNDRRCARDSYALSTILASRRQVKLIAARRDGSLSLVNHPARRLTGLSSLTHLDQLANLDPALLEGAQQRGGRTGVMLSG